MGTSPAIYYPYRPIDREIREWCRYNFATGVCSRLFRKKLNFTGENSIITFLCHPLGDLGYMVYLLLVGKRVIEFDFLLLLI